MVVPLLLHCDDMGSPSAVKPQGMLMDGTFIRDMAEAINSQSMYVVNDTPSHS